MRGRHIGALVALVVILGAGMFTYVRTRPRVSDDDITEAHAVTARVRASLDDVECERPPLFGGASEDALPLDELLSRDGPFGECWEVVERLVATYPDALDNPAGFSFYGRYNRTALWDMGTNEAVVTRCAELPEEVRLQARTPDRCTPYSPSSEEWREVIAEPYDERSKSYFAHAVTMMARHAEMSDDDRFRLFVQGMAVGRDLSQGPGVVDDGIEIEGILAASLARHLEEQAPSPTLGSELHDALQLLADGTVDAHAFVMAQGLWFTDEDRHYNDRDDERGRLRLYTSVALLSRLMHSCPTGVSVEACVAHFPYARRSHPSSYEYWLGDRFVRYWRVEYRHAQWTAQIEEQMFPLEAVRANATALQEMLQWSTDKAAGTCPEVSSWAYDEDDPRPYIDRDDSRTHYRWITPGPVRSALYFRCSVPASSH